MLSHFFEQDRHRTRLSICIFSRTYAVLHILIVMCAVLLDVIFCCELYSKSKFQIEQNIQLSVQKYDCSGEDSNYISDGVFMLTQFTVQPSSLFSFIYGDNMSHNGKRSLEDIQLLYMCDQKKLLSMNAAQNYFIHRINFQKEFCSGRRMQTNELVRMITNNISRIPNHQNVVQSNIPSQTNITCREAVKTS